MVHKAVCILLALATLGLAACARPGPGIGQGPAQPGAQGQTAAEKPAGEQPRTGLGPGDLLDAEGGMSREGFLGLVKDAAYVLIGEEHTNGCDHLVQAELVEAMARAGMRLAVGFEMVAVDRQPILDGFNEGRLTTGDLEAALDWPNTWGYPFALYAPIFHAAERHHIPVFALNAPRELVRKANRDGLDSLSPAERGLLPERVIGPSEEQKRELEVFFKNHHGIVAKSKPDAKPASFETFLFTQSLWDTQMADRAARIRKATGRTVAVIAGGGHVERGWGVKRRLDILDHDATSRVVMPFRGFEEDEIEHDAADAFFYCPTSRTSRLGFSMEMRRDGARVLEVQPNSLAFRAGMRAGDVVVRAGGEPVDSLWSLHQASLSALKERRPLLLEVMRQGETVPIEIDLSEAHPGPPSDHMAAPGLGSRTGTAAGSPPGTE
jgi:uncharacterized iron-regulated protein